MTRRGAASSAAATVRRADLAAVLLLLLLAAILAWNRAIFDSWQVRMDLLTFFLPWYTFLGDSLRTLSVPAWNPHLFSGAPFAGDPESGWMYFPAMLMFALIPQATAAFTGMVVVQLAVAAGTTYALGRVLGMGTLGSFTAALLYLTGPFLHWNTHCCLIFSQFATWIPLSLLGIELALQAADWRSRLVPWCLSAFALSQMVAGWIGEGWLYAFLLPAAYIGYRTFLSPPQPGIFLVKRLLTGFATGLATLGLGSALAAAGMLPRYLVNAETNLAGGDYSKVGDAVLNPPWTVDYLLSQTLGVGSGYHYRAAAFGGVAIVLALLALPLVKQRYAAPFFLILTLVAMILTLEKTPLHTLFYLIPRFREFNEHDAWRTMALAAIGPAMLSGATIDALPRLRGRLRLAWLTLLPLIFLLVVALLLQISGRSLGWPPLLAATLATGLILAYLLTPQVAWTARLLPLLLVVAFIFPTGLELTSTWLGWPRDEAVARQLQRAGLDEAALQQEIRRDDPGGAGEFLQRAMAESGPFRYFGYSGIGYPGDEGRQQSYMERRLDPAVQAVLVNGRPIFLNLDEIQGYNPLQLSRYVAFMTALNGAPQDYHTAFVLPSGVRSPLLDLLDVRYVLVDASLPPDRDDVRALQEGRHEVFRNDRVVIYEREPIPPRAWIVHDVRGVASHEVLPLLSAGTVDPYRIALVEGPPPAVAPAPAGAEEDVRVVASAPGSLTLVTNSVADGFLVVSEVYANGWSASIDGVTTPVLPTFTALQGLALPAGEHIVTLRYDPFSLRLGLWISAIALLTMLSALGYAAWRTWSRPKASYPATLR